MSKRPIVEKNSRDIKENINWHTIFSINYNLFHGCVCQDLYYNEMLTRNIGLHDLN